MPQPPPGTCGAAAAFGVADGFSWPTWAGFLAVGLLVLLAALVLALLALRQVKKVKGLPATTREASRTGKAFSARKGKGAALVAPAETAPWLSAEARDAARAAAGTAPTTSSPSASTTAPAYAAQAPTAPVPGPGTDPA